MHPSKISAAAFLLLVAIPIAAQDAAGAALGPAKAFEASGKRVLIEQHAYTTATTVDLNGDGLFDVVLGWYDYDMKTKTPSQQGRIYLNTGKLGAPTFGKPVQIKVDGSAEIWDTY